MNIKSKVALVAIAVASVVLAGSISPADAHKSGGKQEKYEKHSKHDKNDKPKTPQNPGPIGPLPKPPVAEQPQWHAKPTPVVVRDHRTPAPAPEVRDHRAKPVVVDHRAGTKVAENKAGSRTKTTKACLGSLCVSHPKLGAAVDRLPR